MPAVRVKEVEAVFSVLTGDWEIPVNSVAAGNLIVIIARMGTSNRTPGVPVSDGSATFAQLQTIGGTAVGSMYLWAGVENTAGNRTYTITIAGGLTALGALQAWEISGADDAAPTSGTSTQSTATTAPRCLTTGITIPAGGIFVGGISTQGNVSVGTWGGITTPTGFTTVFSSTSAPTASVFFADSTTAATAVQGIASTTTARTFWGLAVVFPEKATGAFTLAADVGTLTVTGQAAGTNAASLLTADQGALALAGQAANTNAAAALAADFAALTLTGQAAGISAAALFPADFGALVVNGQAAGVNAAASLTAEAGALALAGQAAALTVGATLPADAGALLFSGQDATLTVSIPITAGPLAVFQTQVSQPGPLAVQVDCPGPQAAQISQPGPLAVQL
jgi:hypothetical protein